MEGECEMSQSTDLGGVKGRHLRRERRDGTMGISYWQIPLPKPNGENMQERRARTVAPQVMEQYMKKMEGTGRE